jgi:TolA-binding protein
MSSARPPLAVLAALGLFPLAAVAGDPPKTLGSLSGQTVELQPDAPIPDAERQARENYRKFLLLSTSDPKLSAEALRRLGDLELEAGESASLKQGVDRPPAASYSKAVQLYRQLLEQHPDAPRNDLVYYQLARAQESGGDALAALVTLDQLVARYPHTLLLDEVQFRRGEILFSHQRYPEAEHAYAAVLPLNVHSAYREQSLYKLGWSLFKQDRYDDSLGIMFQLLDARLGGIAAADVDPHIAALPPPVHELIDDTLRVMSLSFSYLEGEKSLRQTLQRHGQPPYGHLLYLSLASQYMEQKRYTDAAAVLMGFVDAQPLHPRAPELYIQAVASLEQGNFPAQVLAAREGYVKRFGLEQPYWKAQPAAANPAALAFLRDSVWMQAQQHHALAQSKDPAAAADKAQNYQLAAEWYRRYLGYFPKDEKAPECQFLLGEVLFESGDYAGAVAAYEASAYQYPAHAHSAEAGYAALLAYIAREAQLSGADKTAWHRHWLDAELQFAAAFPTDSHAVAVRVNAAEGLYAAGARAEAIAAATPATTLPQADAAQRRVAWVVIGHASFDTQDFARAEDAYHQAQQMDLATGRRDPDLAEHLAAAIYRQAEQARDAGKTEAAAAAFLRVGQAAPESTIHATADYDAAQAYISGGQTAAAIPLLLAFRSQHPDSQLAAQASASLALAYLKTGDNSAAAHEFERIANAPSSTKAEQQEALQQAIKLYAAAQDGAGEARTLSLQVQRYPESFAQTLEAQRRLIELATARGDNAAVRDLSARLIAYDAGAGAARTDRSRFLAAHATLTLAQPARDAFLAAPLKVPLKDSLRNKKALMEAALAAYGKAADYGVADVLTEATYQIGEIYNGLAKALYASERPHGLDPQAREQYDLLLQEQAFPFEEKAIELHEANVKRARDGVYDQWVRSSYASLAVLVPARYARPPHGEPYVEALR